MNPKVKKAWIKALRSGEYEQGQGSYYHYGRYCCLGVLMRVLGMPQMDWSFCAFEQQTKLAVSDAVELAALNDSGATFEQIALLIENGL